jgi:isoquinoline 1-oxidoreductase beta subunit
MKSKPMSRRAFLKKSLAGAGLTIGLSMTSSGCKLIGPERLREQSTVPYPLTAWIQVIPDETVRCILNKSEMGQGVYTSLPMIIADEMEADWTNICFQAAPAAKEYVDPAFGMQMTGGSTSIRHMFEPLRKAAAAAREMLVSTAAAAWGVPASECAARQGKVRHAQSGRSLTYGQLCERASKLPVPENPPLKKESQFRLIGTSMSRLDVWDKINGTATFGTDNFVPGMVYASIARPPASGASVVTIDRGVAVCATTFTAAQKGREALQVKWDQGSNPALDNETLEKEFIAHLKQPGVIARNEGNCQNGLQQAVKKTEATYVLPYLAHATMEPMNCTAWIRPDRCDIWASTQNQTGVLQQAEKITGLRPEQIHVHTTYLGGGFGRRAETDVLEEVLQVARATGKPVKLLWPREDDFQNDFYRPGNCCRIEGGIGPSGHVIAWSHKVAVPSIFVRFFPQMVKNGVDPAAVEGIVDPYEVQNVLVEYVRVDTPVPVGFWRSVGNSHNAFTVECFIDELAHLAQRDPLEFRLSHLRNHPRACRVLEAAAEKADWAKSRAAGRSLGVAYHFSFETHVAQVAEISVDGKDGRVKVHKVTCAVDCGRVVNPSIITAQMESGILMGLSAALKEKVEFAKGGIISSNFDDYEILRMSEVPEIEVHLIKSNDAMGGIGEPGLPPVAPALGNAIFNAAGVRIRRLPLAPDTVLEALRRG